MQDMNLIDFLDPKISSVVAGLLVMGGILKSIPKIPNWTIPFILLAIGITFSILTLGVTSEAVLQGIIATGISVFTHQIAKQGKDGITKK